ncbi:MAG: DUF1552 domain-containing protein [Planctomycetaceae bacterium]|nr:MAG: DUF1552 domain-containing protein [Planctomycetaceae bacterium]
MFAMLQKKRLPRRAMLRGAGVTLALPWLDAMLPALASKAEAAEASDPPKRFVAVNYGLGFHSPHLFPEQEGANYQATPYLKLLEEHRDQFSVISGLSHPEQNGANGHTSEFTVLTSMKHPGLPGFKNGISIDQYLADQLQPDTRFSSLVLNVGGRDSISWSATGVNLPAAGTPEELFKMMFVTGTPDEVAKQTTELKRGRSILDAVNDRARSLQRQLGPRDQDKFDQYLTSVRELEQRLQSSEAWAKKPKPTVDVAPPANVTDRLDFVAQSRVMHQMLALALQSDSTRIITLKSTAMNDVPKLPGVDTGWHDLSHHGQDEQKIDELKLIEEAEFREINGLMTLLRSAREAGGSVLDSTHLLITSNLGNASSHSWRDLPVILAGGGFHHGRHIVAGGSGHDNARFCNLFVQIAQRMGVDTEGFGSSDGTSVKGLA